MGSMGWEERRGEGLGGGCESDGRAEVGVLEGFGRYVGAKWGVGPRWAGPYWVGGWMDGWIAEKDTYVGDGKVREGEERARARDR